MFSCSSFQPGLILGFQVKSSRASPPKAPFTRVLLAIIEGCPERPPPLPPQPPAQIPFSSRMERAAWRGLWGLPVCGHELGDILGRAMGELGEAVLGCRLLPWEMYRTCVTLQGPCCVTQQLCGRAKINEWLIPLPRTVSRRSVFDISTPKKAAPS